MDPDTLCEDKMKLDNDKGTVLLIAVFIIALSSILVIGFLEAATTDIEISRNQKNGCLAVYIADAGEEAAIYDLLNGGDGNIARTEFPDTADDNTYYTVVRTGKFEGVYSIESTGEFGDFQKVIVAKIEITKMENKAILRYWKQK